MGRGYMDRPSPHPDPPSYTRLTSAGLCIIMPHFLLFLIPTTPHPRMRNRKCRASFRHPPLPSSCALVRSPSKPQPFPVMATLDKSRPPSFL